jgi:hypothetical protein
MKTTALVASLAAPLEASPQAQDRNHGFSHPLNLGEMACNQTHLSSRKTELGFTSIMSLPSL